MFLLHNTGHALTWQSDTWSRSCCTRLTELLLSSLWRWRRRRKRLQSHTLTKDLRAPQKRFEFSEFSLSDSSVLFGSWTYSRNMFGVHGWSSKWQSLWELSEKVCFVRGLSCLILIAVFTIWQYPLPHLRVSIKCRLSDDLLSLSCPAYFCHLIASVPIYWRCPLGRH